VQWVAIVSAIGTALSGLGATIAALAALGVLRARREAENLNSGPKASRLSTVVDPESTEAHPNEPQPERSGA
jgi:hypothetical protein